MVGEGKPACNSALIKSWLQTIFVNLKRNCRMIRLAILILLLSSCSSYSETPSLLGQWIPLKVSGYNVFNKTTLLYYDKHHQEMVKRQLLERYIAETKANLEHTSIDTTAYKRQLDKDFQRFLTAKIIFKPDSTVYIESNGLLIPTAVPGYNFDDTVTGKWTQPSRKHLKIAVGNYPFFYRVSKLTLDTPILEYTGEGYQEQAFMKLQFTR
jgi:hypothetical protein